MIDPQTYNLLKINPQYTSMEKPIISTGSGKYSDLSKTFLIPK